MSGDRPQSPAGQNTDAQDFELVMLREIIEAMPSAIVVIDDAGRIRRVNAHAERLFGYDRDELLDQPVEILVPDDVRDGHLALRKAFLKHPSARPMSERRDLHARAKDGREIPVEIGLNPISTEVGAFVLAAAVVDLSERVELNDRFRLAVEAAPNAMLMINAEGVITMANVQAENTFGYSRQQLLGRSIETLVPERYRGRHPDLRQAYFGTPERRAMGAGRELFGLTRDGREVPIEIGLNPIDTPDGLFALASIIDITERKRAESQQAELNASLEKQVRETRSALASLRNAQSQLAQAEKLAALGSLVAGITHEVNTPIGVSVTAASHMHDAVATMADAAARNELTQRRFNDHLRDLRETSEIILNNLNRAADLVHSFKQVAVDQTSSERRRFDLKGYLNEVLLSLRPQFKRTHHRIVIECPDDLELDTYPGALAQVLTNLLMNALKHAFKDIDAGTIRITAARAGDEVELEFADSGSGMAPATLKRAFEPYFTTDRAGGGSGLGLHLVHNLVTATLKGRIEAHSTPGEGTRFTIRIPASVGASDG